MSAPIATAESSAPAPAVEVVPTPSADPVSDDAWRADSIDVLADHGLKPATIAKLRDSGNIYKLGELADFTDPAKNGGNPHRRITEIKGIGANALTDAEQEAFIEMVQKLLGEVATQESVREFHSNGIVVREKA